MKMNRRGLLLILLTLAIVLAVLMRFRVQRVEVDCFNLRAETGVRENYVDRPTLERMDINQEHLRFWRVHLPRDRKYGLYISVDTGRSDECLVKECEEGEILMLDHYHLPGVEHIALQYQHSLNPYYWNFKTLQGEGDWYCSPEVELTVLEIGTRKGKPGGLRNMKIEFRETPTNSAP